MFATPTLRSAIRLLLVAALLFSATACRTGSTPEAGVDARLFEKPGASIGYNSRGYWFAVAPQNAPITDFVTIEHDGKTELFYAVARGQRAAQLLPLTPVDSPWFASAVEAGAAPDFVDDLTQLSLSDPVGLWSGKASDAVQWTGHAPSTTVSAVALSASAPKRPVPFYRLAKGVVDVDGDRVGRQAGSLDEGPFVLLPETAKSAQPLHVVDLSSSALSAPDDSTIALETRPGSPVKEDRVFAYALLPVGYQEDADLLFFDVGTSPFVFYVGGDHARLGKRARLVAAIAKTPLLLHDADASARVMRGFQALREGRALAASYWLRPDELGLPQNRQASALRLAELPAAAAMTQWSRVALFENADGMSADRVLYLARAHALEGDLTQAASYAARAAKSFRSWPAPTNHTGAARAKLLGARLAFVEGNHTQAIELARDAVAGFERANDELRQADAELELADYLFAAGSPDNAIKYADLARSRYYHGGAPHASALAEIKLAELLLDHSQIDPAQIEKAQIEKALEMAGFARARMEKFDEPVGRARAALVEVLALKAAGQKRDITGELKNALSRAQAHRDPRTEALAAASQVTRAGVDDPKRMAELGSLLASRRDDVTDPWVAREVERALASLCGRGLAGLTKTSGGVADVAQTCAVALAGTADDPETLRAWLEQGYSALQHGNRSLAESSAEQLTSSLDEAFELSSPVLAAEILFFQYAVQTLPGPERRSASEQDSALVERAFSLLQNGVDPAQSAERLHDLALAHRARGLSDIAARLGTRAMNAAREQKNYQKERDLLFFLLDTYHMADRPDDVLELARDGRKVVSRAGPGSETLEARVLIYQSDAEYRLRRASDAGLHRSNVLATAKNTDDATRLELLLLAAQLDLERRAIAAAEPIITSALGLYQALGPKTRTEPRFVAHLTRLHTLHGELGLRLGKLDAARKAFATALELSKDVDAANVRELRARALIGQAGLADEAASATYEGELDSLLDRLGDFAERQPAIDAHRNAVEYYADAGRASVALDLAERVHDAGFSLAPRHLAPCVTARPRLFAGKSELAMRDLKTCAANNRGRVAGEFATLLLALTDKALDAAQRAKAAATAREILGDKLTAAERDRLTFIESLASPANTFDARRAARLEKSADANPDAAHVEAFAAYLLSVGRLSQASAYIDEHSSVFFEQGQESPGTLIRLRLEAMVRQLQPVEASLFAQRALSESAGLDPTERARIDFLLAQNEVVIGRWWRAADMWAQAKDAATDRGLKRQIDAFAKEFPQVGNPN